jgi:hypothetical protein
MKHLNKNLKEGNTKKLTVATCIKFCNIKKNPATTLWDA